jgi:hypothetical protein
MKVLINGDGWSSLEIFLYIFLTGLIVAPVICIVVFILRKDKLWLNYVALAGEILFFIKILFHLQHYPGQWELSIAGAPLLLIAFIATLRAERQGKIQASTKLGVILCLYVLMLINLSQGIFNHRFKAPPNPVESKPELSPQDKRFIDSVRKLYKIDTLPGNNTH